MDVRPAVDVHSAALTITCHSDSGMQNATRARIGAAIDELGYRPNLTARAMRTHRAGL
ncbi:hypothetical protein AB0H45_09470 [Streptomyces atroolivaceus]|uniref:HTH lacI-type domain-containing protein n=1 Tax=Streptomyces atroolivaceus TaxID=66869 RepID=A0ABV9V861_STRAZ